MGAGREAERRIGGAYEAAKERPAVRIDMDHCTPQNRCYNADAAAAPNISETSQGFRALPTNSR